MGRKQTLETRAKISATRIRLGLKPSEACLKASKREQVGPKHPRWNKNKDVDAIDRQLFQTYVAPLVKQRDNYICALCTARGGQLHSHHIKAFAVCPELRFSFVNTITLCNGCHKDLHAGRFPEKAPSESSNLWVFLRSQLTNKLTSQLEINVLEAVRAYRDVLVAHTGDISGAWATLDSSLRAYKEHFNYD